MTKDKFRLEFKANPLDLKFHIGFLISLIIFGACVYFLVNYTLHPMLLLSALLSICLTSWLLSFCIQRIIFGSSLKVILDKEGISLLSLVPRYLSFSYFRSKRLLWKDLDDIIGMGDNTLVFIGNDVRITLPGRVFPNQSIYKAIYDHSELQWVLGKVDAKRETEFD